MNAAPVLVTAPPGKSRIAISRLSIGSSQLGLTPSIPAEDTFILALYLTDLAHHELWSRGRPVISQGYAANSIRIVNLAEEYSANIVHPHESLAFYVPRTAIEEIAQEMGGRGPIDLVCQPGFIDPVVQSLGFTLLPAFERADEVHRIFLDQISISLCSHLLGRFGWDPLESTCRHASLSIL